ncbi:MAG: tyrosinase family protein [Pseudomonadota bacterium]
MGEPAMRHVTVAGLAMCAAVAAMPEAAAQQVISRGGSFLEAKLLAGGRMEDGRQSAALVLKVKPGWKTYWRQPGEAGVPPQFDWTGSDNLADIEVGWPAPVVFESFGYRTLGYGGPISGFAQQGSAFGANESDPHNLVHVMIGGGVAVDPPGWMFDPNFAALDPIFWVHHCNVDRLWAAWMTDPAHSQEDSSPWRNGPFPRQFTMPDSTGGLSVFVPSETLPGEALEPSYDDLIDGTGIVPPPVVGGLEMMAARSPGRGSSALIGANESAVTVGRGQVSSRIAMTARPGAGAGALEGMGAGGGERVYLNLEGVRGESASGVLNVVLTKAGADPAAESAEAVKTLVFFGLGNATSAEGPHGGSGLSATVEVTDIVRRLEATGTVGEIEAHVAQPSGDGPEITVDRITLYARPDG